MSPTHPNLIPSDVLSSMSQREDMSKNKFWDFRFDRLWLYNFQFGYRPKSSNHIILVFAHPISKLKIDPERSWSKEFMVRNPFWDFECYIVINTCDSSPLPRAKIRPVTPEKSIFFRILIEVTFWLFNLEEFALGLEQISWAQVIKNFKSWRRIGFRKNSKCRIHTSTNFHLV